MEKSGKSKNEDAKWFTDSGAIVKNTKTQVKVCLATQEILEMQPKTLRCPNKNKCQAGEAVMRTPRQFGAWGLGEAEEFTSESQLAD